MALQSTNRTAIAKVREVTLGTTPASPAFKARRQTSSSLAFNPQTVESNEIRSDRQVTDLVLTGIQAGGDVGGELAFNVCDDDLEEALQGTWANKPTITVLTSDTEISDLSTTTATVSAGGAAFVTGMLTQTSGFTTAANNKTERVSSSTATTIVYPSSTFTAEGAAIPVGATIRAIGFQGASGDLVLTTSGGNGMTSTLLDFTTLGLVPGEWLKQQGWATAADNDFYRISSVTAHKIFFDRVPLNFVADPGTAVVITAYFGDVLVNGTTLRSSTIERQYLDQSPVSYEYFTGQCVDKLSVDASAQKIMTYTISYVGTNASITTTRASGATDIAAPTNDVMNTSSNVGELGFNGVAVATPNYIMNCKFDIQNNLRRQVAVGSIGAVGIGNGEFKVSGTLSFYFGDKSVLDKIISNARTSYYLPVGRADNNAQKLMFDFPSIKLSSGSPSVSGKNADVMIDAGFQALRDPTLLYTMYVGRFWYTT